MANATFTNGSEIFKTFGSINGDMPQVEECNRIEYDIERMMCEYEEKRQYVERNTKTGDDLYPNDTKEYRAEMHTILSNLKEKGFSIVL